MPVARSSSLFPNVWLSKFDGVVVDGLERDGKEIFGIIGGVSGSDEVGVGVIVGVVDGEDVSGIEKLILGLGVGFSIGIGWLGGVTIEGVGVGVGSETVGTIGCETGVEGTLGSGETGTISFAFISGASEPKSAVTDGISGIWIFLISAIFISRDIFSRVVEVTYPSNNDSFNIRSKRSIATWNA